MTEAPAGTPSLDVWLAPSPVPIGHIRPAEPGRPGARALTFTYAPGYRGLPLSASLPVRPEAWADRDCRVFFDNLLPEGEQRDAAAARHRLDSDDVFGLLALLGADAPGAVSIVPSGQATPKSPGRLPEDYEPLDGASLEEAVRAVAAGRAPGRDGMRFSLAGVQRKLALAREGGRFLVPRGGAPSTHILKFGEDREPGIVANELLCLRVFRALGLPAAEAEAVEIAGVRALLVTRFDRFREGAVIERRHQEDAAQALGIPRSLKYEAQAREAGLDAGLGALLGRFAGMCRQPIAARDALLRATFLNWLLGNSDAHAKNFALLHGAPGTAPGLAPFYDIVCIPALGRPYNLAPAMRIGEATSWEDVRRRDWEAVARLAQPRAGAAALRRMVDRLWPLAVGLLPALDGVVASGAVSRMEAKRVRDLAGERLRLVNATMGWAEVPVDTDAAFSRPTGGWAGTS